LDIDRKQTSDQPPPDMPSAARLIQARLLVGGLLTQVNLGCHAFTAKTAFNPPASRAAAPDM